MPTGAVCPFVNGPAPYGDRVEREDRMIRTTLRTALLGLVITLTLAACSSGPGGSSAAPQGPSQPAQPVVTASFSWADVVSEYRLAEAVYALGIYLPDGSAYVIGTGFAAHYTNALWTNAHVALALRDQLASVAHLQPIPFAVESGTVIGSGGTYVLTGFDIHPDYDERRSTPDIASIDIQIEGELPVVLDLVPREFTTQLQVGQPIATMGFPQEINHPYTVAPIATFKDGTISALRPFQNESPTPRNTRVVQHNLGTTGGTSGSPIIDIGGNVIAVHYAGFGVVVVFDPATGQPLVTSTAGLSGAIRADEVWAMVDLFESSGKRVAASTRPVLDSYQAFPENWDGTTVAP